MGPEAEVITLHHAMGEWTTWAFWFMSGMSLFLTWVLVASHFRSEGTRRLPRWLVFVQAAGWSVLITRICYILAEGHHDGPSWWLFTGLLLMLLGQAGHAYKLLQRNWWEHLNEGEEG